MEVDDEDDDENDEIATGAQKTVSDRRDLDSSSSESEEDEVSGEDSQGSSDESDDGSRRTLNDESEENDSGFGNETAGRKHQQHSGEVVNDCCVTSMKLELCNKCWFDMCFFVSYCHFGGIVLVYDTICCVDL